MAEVYENPCPDLEEDMRNEGDITPEEEEEEHDN